MEEKIIIKSERTNILIPVIILVVVGFVILGLYTLFDINRYTPQYERLAALNYDWFDYSSALDMAVHQDGGFLIALAIPVIFIIIAIIYYRAHSKIELTVTDKRVYGRATFGKRVDLPLDSISAVGTKSKKGIAVTTASGAIKFNSIRNRDAIHAAISNLLIERQSKPTAAAANAPSNADELKKYKDLLDSGVISQEEFDAKKEQLLGL